MKRGEIIFFAFFVIVLFQFTFISAGYVTIVGCKGTPSSCTTLTSNSCYCTATSGTTSCTLTGFTRAAYCNTHEGDYYVKASSNCISSLTSVPFYVSAFTINWDNNKADCDCKVGTGRWNLPGIRTGSCCGDDSTEHYISATSSQNKIGVAHCCDDSTDYVVTSGSCCNLANYAGLETGKSCDGTYSCCTSTTDLSKGGTCVSTCSEILDAFWENNAPYGNSARGLVEIAGVNATVNMVVETEYFGNKMTNFTIYNQFNNPIQTIGNVVKSEEDRYSVSWKVPSEGIYYFRAVSSDGTTATFQSNLLYVESPSSNLPVFANIFSPIQGKFYMKNQNILFSANGSYDLDDEITATLWNLDDGKSSTLWEFQDSYNSKGQKEVVLTVVGGRVFEGRARSSSAFVSIMVYDSPGIYVFANISSPVRGEKISGKNFVFNSEGSYAKECLDDLCVNFNPKSLDFYKWELFREEGSSYEKIGESTGATAFTWEVSNLIGIANYKIKLTVGHEGVYESTERYFSVIYLDDVEPISGWVCVDGGTKWRNVSDDSEFSSLMDCKKEGVEGSCCPEGSECINGICVECPGGFCEENTFFLCASYFTQESCNSYSDSVAKASIKDKREDSKTCPDLVGFENNCYYMLDNCRCEWNSEIEECVAKSDTVVSYCEGDVNLPNFFLGTCTYSESLRESSCDEDGFLRYSWNAEWTWASGVGPEDDLLGESSACVSGERAIPCPAEIALSFFTASMVLITIAIIALVYYFLFLSKRKTERGKASSKKVSKKKR